MSAPVRRHEDPKLELPRFRATSDSSGARVPCEHISPIGSFYLGDPSVCRKCQEAKVETRTETLYYPQWEGQGRRDSIVLG